MPTFSALTTLPGRAGAEALGAALEALAPEPTGVGVFEIEDGSGLWEVGGYFLAEPDAVGLAILAAAFGAQAFSVSELPDIDWVAKVRRELSPVVAGRFFVHGSHDADKVPDGAVALLIEAAMAFGTGHHGTTVGCLRALDRLVGGGLCAARVADIGCGTAVLAMAAARVWPHLTGDAAVIASDIDPVAVDVARANVAANGLAGCVTVLEAAGFAHPRLTAGRFDLIFANILMAPLIDLAPAMARQVMPGGRAVLSGVLTPQAADVMAAYAAAGFDTQTAEEIGDWSTLTVSRRQT